MIDFGVIKGPASNALFRRANQIAAAMQSPIEELEEEEKRKITHMPHLRTTDKYNKDEDTKPRQTLTPSSSWIEGVQFDPNTNTARIEMGGEWYDFSPAYGTAFTPDEMKDFLTSDSLGSWLWNNNKFISKGRK